MKRDFLEVDDLSPDELMRVLDLSEQNHVGSPLAGRGAVLLFEKPSARTRASMEMALVQLGGHPVTLRGEEVGIDSREPAEDLARLFSGYGSFIGARVFEHSKVERLAANSTVPVINLLSDESHPIQALADLLTIRSEFGTIAGLNIAYIGDANNVARSLTIGCSLLGANVTVCNPPGYGFNETDLGRLTASGCTFDQVDDPTEAVDKADVVYTDAWYSMGQEDQQAERRSAFAAWQVDAPLMDVAGERAIFLHCLPAHRGDEVTPEVIDGPRSRVWPQAHNRMHSARGLILWLIEVGAIEVGASDPSQQ